VNISPWFIQTGVTFFAASLGAVFGAFLTRRIEQFKHIQELRSKAYSDFLRGSAKVAIAQHNDQRSDRSKLAILEGLETVADSRARIVIYGSPEVLRSLARFANLGTQTISKEGMQAFAELCSLMREEAIESSASLDDIRTVLFR
jgi:hypothetical protein